MTANTNPIFIEVPKAIGVKIAAADTTTKKDAYVAGLDGGAVFTLQACSFDTVDRVFVLSYFDGTNTYQVGEVSVPAFSGTNGVLQPKRVLDVSLLPVLDGDSALILSANSKLQINAKVAVTGDVHFTGSAGDY
jgi:hypothetical protein